MGSLSLYSISTLFVILATISPSLAAEDDAGFAVCSRPFSCGICKNLSFPFWSDTGPQYCGHEGYKLKCNGDGSHPVIVINEREFQILRINQSAQPQMMTLSWMNSGKDSCPTALNHYLFKPAKTVVNVTLLRNCPESADPLWKRIAATHKIQCTVDGKPTYLLFLRDNETHLVDCRDKVEVPVPEEALNQLISGTISLSKALMTEFDVQYLAYDEYCLKCQGSGGRCGSGHTSSLSFACYCRDRPYDITCGTAHLTFLSTRVLTLYRFLVNNSY
ncbi:hypothetical protein SLEP1_g47217 [Rubroshorea leprosula]|uniref:non-specific serine/threonine protein kinase n=1 Tax=Rubroshorea leprosula TaxID=152421 RepID=A0AAV5LPU2_9ROSI|nr:hypothetical protein SLEP1_g47217 [Rubroshorea leprosula]